MLPPFLCKIDVCIFYSECCGQKVMYTFYSTYTCLKVSCLWQLTFGHGFLADFLKSSLLGLHKGFARNSISNRNIEQKNGKKKWPRGQERKVIISWDSLRAWNRGWGYSVPRVRTFSAILAKIFLPLLYPSYNAMIVKFQSKGISVVLRLISMNFYLH